MLHDAAPGPRRRHQDQAVPIEPDAADLIAAQPAGIGGGIDAGHQGRPVEGIISAI